MSARAWSLRITSSQESKRLAFATQNALELSASKTRSIWGAKRSNDAIEDLRVHPDLRVRSCRDMSILRADIPKVGEVRTFGSIVRQIQNKRHC